MDFVVDSSLLIPPVGVSTGCLAAERLTKDVSTLLVERTNSSETVRCTGGSEGFNETVGARPVAPTDSHFPDIVCYQRTYNYEDGQHIFSEGTHHHRSTQ